MSSKLLKIGLFIIVLGAVSLGLEKVFYGGIDSNGVLQESFFLPLSFLLWGLGVLLIIGAFLLKLMRPR
ncbi:DUF3955 domain-containing protein [Pseudovibrio exalbescens]|uniref:DUF3955 domain-containing protein n=1 Tax=Pseudovibrio exalbescens TaxID=197461 RepID=A0A1U7JC32_9HYPH|nr:DUF3955 domain-containing protein [Pseudovibrio exalbescens]OKL42258.1 hypothetical protein A3843_00775 [Pseudovibrio exalbescens]